MNRSRWRSRRAAAAAAAACAAAALAAAGLSTAQAAVIRPTTRPAARSAGVRESLKLLIAQHVVTAQRFGKYVYIDPGIYVAAIGKPLRIDVQRASYTRPVTVTQVIRRRSGGVRRRRLPASVNDNWNGLRDFARISMRNKAGAVVMARNMPFCPDFYSPERVTPSSPVNPLYPNNGCSSYDPFPLGEVWGLQRGWAVDPFALGGGIVPLPSTAVHRARPAAALGTAFHRSHVLPLGWYQVTVRIKPEYLKMFHITAAHSSARVLVHVVKGGKCCLPATRRHHSGARQQALPALPKVPTLKRVPVSAEPDLIPLPAWGILVRHVGKKGHPGTDLLQFNGTVWDGGNGPIDVEGFRRNASPVMPAYQYFWRNGHVIGRVRAGTMGFGRKGKGVWHFEQFAKYLLLNADKKLAVKSGKVGFCIAPTDSLNLLLPHAVWQLQFTGYGGECGSTSALWVQEELPVGWGDTYSQAGVGGAFDITKVPNGTYYIETDANPEHVLRETNTANDVTLRKIILGGTPGHRTVKVPAWHGIDSEK